MQECAERELQFSRFCSYSVGEVVGAGVEGEQLYVVQAQKISVYEYHGNLQKPQLCEQLIHNQPILDFALSPSFICIRSQQQLELRDRRHWENVVLTYPAPPPEQFLYLALDARFVYLGHRDAGGWLVVDKIDTESKALVAVINLGKTGGTVEQLRRVRPIFLQQLGMLHDFYIWPRSVGEVELGMLYTMQGTAKRKFQINQIAIPDGNIVQLYHHRVLCSKYPAQSPEYVILVVEKQQKQLFLQLCEIIPREERRNQEPQGDDFHGQVQNILTQFSFLKNLNDKPSLVQEVFSEAIEGKPPSQTHAAQFQVRLEGISKYEASFLKEGKLWVVGEGRVCEVQLALEENIEVIVKSYRSEQKVVRSLRYQDKPLMKQCLGLYQSRLLFSEITSSFEIAHPKEPHEEIAEEIEEYEVNDEILEKQAEIKKEAEIKITAEAERLRKDFLLLTSGDGQEEALPQMEKEKPVPKPQLNEYFSQTEPDQPKSMCECAIQTQPVVNVGVGLEELQDLVAKYSSAFTVSCGKVKQNHYLKDKFDREIFNIVDGVLKETLQPFLEARFLALLDSKITQVSQQISGVFEGQVEALNELMRKNEAKENGLRGKRIFEFANQINHIKETVGSLTDAVKANQLQKHAFGELLLEEARLMREEITKVSTAMAQMENKNDAAEKAVGDQIGELFEMLKTLEERQKENARDDSSSSSGESEKEEQREIEEASSEEAPSDSDASEGEEVQHRYPPRGGQQLRKKKKSFDGFDSQGYAAYPGPEYYHHAPPPQMPYYYPFMPQTPSMPMPAYYRPNYYPPSHVIEETSKIQLSKKGKVKRSKRTSD